MALLAPHFSEGLGGGVAWWKLLAGLLCPWHQLGNVASAIHPEKPLHQKLINLMWTIFQVFTEFVTMLLLLFLFLMLWVFLTWRHVDS